MREEQKIKLDPWQKEVLEHKGSITIRAGRQVGKSTVIALKCVNFALENPGTVTLVIAASQRQSSYLFEKIRAEFDLVREYGGEDPFDKTPTQTKIILKNKSIIYSLPAGRSGHFIRGLTVDLLIADEAAYIPEPVWLAAIPMLAVSRKTRGFGWMILLSTPFGKGGYFYESFTDKDYRSWHISSEKCERIPKSFLIKEKQRLSRAEYAQEYLGEFVDEWNQFFGTDLILKCMTFMFWNYKKDFNRSGRYYLGIDVARYGGDENAFVVSELVGDKTRIVFCEKTTRVSLLDTASRTQILDDKFNFRKIFIDDAGVGGGLLDILQDKIGRKVIGINNASKSVMGKTKRILKEDLYSNALRLMEMGKIEIINHLGLKRSLKSMTYEYGSDKQIKIFGRYPHFCEAFVRACWAEKEKGLKLFVA